METDFRSKIGEIQQIQNISSKDAEEIAYLTSFILGSQSMFETLRTLNEFDSQENAAHAGIFRDESGYHFISVLAIKKNNISEFILFDSLNYPGQQQPNKNSQEIRLTWATICSYFKNILIPSLYFRMFPSNAKRFIQARAKGETTRGLAPSIEGIVERIERIISTVEKLKLSLKNFPYYSAYKNKIHLLLSDLKIWIQKKYSDNKNQRENLLERVDAAISFFN